MKRDEYIRHPDFDYLLLVREAQIVVCKLETWQKENLLRENVTAEYGLKIYAKETPTEHCLFGEFRCEHWDGLVSLSEMRSTLVPKKLAEYGITEFQWWKICERFRNSGDLKHISRISVKL